MPWAAHGTLEPGTSSDRVQRTHCQRCLHPKAGSDLSGPDMQISRLTHTAPRHHRPIGWTRQGGQWGARTAMGRRRAAVRVACWEFAAALGPGVVGGAWGGDMGLGSGVEKY